MPRTWLLPISTLVLLATATTVLASSILLPMPNDAGQMVGASSAVGARFYAAVNTVIATGDPRALREVVAVDFVDEEPLPGLPAGRDGLEAYLLHLHATAPTTRVTGTTLATTSDRVIARATTQESSLLQAPDAIAAPSSVWGAVDILRIDAGLIVGRWSAIEHLTLQRPLATASLTLPVPSPRLLTLSRVTLAPGAHWDATSDGTYILVPEAGAIMLSIAQSTERGSARNSQTKIAISTEFIPGGPSVVASETQFGVTNVGQGPAQMLVVSFAVSSAPNGVSPVSSPLPIGVERHTLAGDMATPLSARRVTVSVERVSLARAAQLTVSSTAGPMLIGVDSGQLVATAGGAMWTRTGANEMNTATDAATLAPGDGLLLPQGEIVALQPGGADQVEGIVVVIHEGPTTDPS